MKQIKYRLFDVLNLKKFASFFISSTLGSYLLLFSPSLHLKRPLAWFKREKSDAPLARGKLFSIWRPVKTAVVSWQRRTHPSLSPHLAGAAT